MIAALDMEQVPMTAEPDASHDFGDKESTMVSCASNDRFGSVRTCRGCGAREVWAGGAGSHYFDSELLRRCHGPTAEERAWGPEHLTGYEV